jgi:LacI family transcriptional regulator
MRAKTTISQIAEKCQVSVSTVSIVLNNKPGVSDTTRNQILQMAEQMGYEIRSKPRQGMLPSGELNTLGMLVKTDSEVLPPSNPFYSQIINGVDEACRDLGMNILFSMLPVDDSNRPDKVPNFIKSNMADGFLMVGTFLDETVSAVLNKWNIPIVLVDGYSDTESYDMVISDNFRAAYQAVEHLIAQGHKHIGLLGGEPNCYPSLQERRNGYFRAMKEHGLSHIYSADFTINRGNFEGLATNFLRQNPQVTAIFAINDDIAVGTIRAAQALGMNVPDDLSVIGYDDTHLATSISPALTTMHVDTVAMGYGAVHLLSMRKHNPNAARVTLVVHPTLVERQSVAKPRK